MPITEFPVAYLNYHMISIRYEEFIRTIRYFGRISCADRHAMMAWPQD